MRERDIMKVDSSLQLKYQDPSTIDFKPLNVAVIGGTIGLVVFWSLAEPRSLLKDKLLKTVMSRRLVLSRGISVLWPKQNELRKVFHKIS